MNMTSRTCFIRHDIHCTPFTRNVY